jgi:hypothetical protein
MEIIFLLSKFIFKLIQSVVSLKNKILFIQTILDFLTFAQATRGCKSTFNVFSTLRNLFTMLLLLLLLQHFT